MNRLALAFGIVCLLQGLSAVPRPEYGLAVSIQNSNKLTDVRNLVGDIKDGITGIVSATLVAGYTPYEQTLTQMEFLISDVGSIIDPILTAYDGLLAANDGLLDPAFNPFLTAIDAAVAYLSGSNIHAIVGVLTNIGYTGIVDQLTDEGDRLEIGLNALKSATENVKTKLAAALAEAGSSNVSTTVLRNHLTLSDMYALLKAANDLKAYLPLLHYIVSTVNEDLQTGDDYLVALQTAIDDVSGTTSGEYLADLQEIIDDIEGTLTTSFVVTSSAYSSIETDVNALTGIASATDFSALQTTISGFINAFSAGAIGPLDLSLAAEFNNFNTELDALISGLVGDSVAVDEPLVQLLVDTLVGNLEYGRYCFHKYKDLVDNLLTQGLEGGWQCVDKEYIRLEHLLGTLELMLDLMVFDHEYMLDEITVCDMISINADDMNACVTELNGYYTALLDATTAKRDLIYELAEGEAEASLNRLLICFQISYIDVSVAQAAEVNTGLQTCAADGPNGSD